MKMKCNQNRMVALVATLVLLFSFSIGDAWGFGHDKHYFQGTANVVNEGTGSGKVYVGGPNSSISDVSEGQWESETSTSGEQTCNESSSNDNLHFFAKADEGSYFWGWYNEETCETRATSDNASYAYDYTWNVDGSSTASGSPETKTLYAKFSNTPLYRYAIGLRAQSETPASGMVQTGSSAISTPSSGSCKNISDLASALTVTPEASATRRAYVGALPTRTHAFVRWDIIGSGVTLAEGSSLTNPTCAFDVNISSGSADAEGKASFQGTVQAVFEDIAPSYQITVTKMANAGTVAVRAKNYYAKSGNTSMEYVEKDVKTIAAVTTSEATDWYPNDEMKFTATSSDAARYRFIGWYDGETLLSTNASYTIPTPSANRTIEARFEEGPVKYYAAAAETNAGGNVKVSFAEITNENPGSDLSATGQSTPLLATSITAHAYFKAVPADGYEFVGWKKSPAGDYVSFNALYDEEFTVTSTENASPTTITMYAYFAKLSEAQAQLINGETGSVISEGNLATVIGAANGKNTLVVMLNNVNLESPVTINKNITLDLNNRTISGTASDLLNITANVTFVDNSIQGAGGVSIKTGAASELHAMKVTSGSLTINKGLIRCENTSDDEAAKAVGISVEGGTLNLMGGTIEGKAVANAYGVKVNAGATANLTLGTINATAASDACGVLANGTTNVSWNVAVNATTTTGDNAVGVLVDDASAIATIDGGIITAIAKGANAYGVQAKQASGEVTIGGNMAVSATATGTTSSAYAVEQEGSAVVKVETGRFKSNNSQEITAATPANLKLYGGYYLHNAALATYKQAGVDQADLKEGTKFYTEGYRYMLSNGDNPNYVVATAFGTGFTKKFSSLEDAILYANNNASTVMTIRLEIPEYTLPSGNYTIPEKATLLIPYTVNQTPKTTVEQTFNKDYVTPSLFCKLIIDSNVHIDVQGTIEVGCKQSAKGQSNNANGSPTGPYGWIYLNEDAEIVVANGGFIRAWGFITGDGMVDVRRGGTVWEQFQILDFKGGSLTRAFINFSADNGHRYFPVNQYFIQNIESKTTYHPGSKLSTMSAVYMSMNVAFNNIQIIGVYNRLDGEADDVAMFLMDDADNSDDTWVRKYYDVSTDYQVYEVNSSARLGSMELEAQITMNSTDFDLPLTNNMRIHLLSGEMGITQRTIMLPGAEIIIDKQSTVVVLDNPLVDYDGALFLYDAAEWGTYVYSGFYAQTARYTPSCNGTNKVRPGTMKKMNSITSYYLDKPSSASINVKGTLDIQGALYTTASGANIFSTNADAGTVHFSVAAAEDGATYHADTRWGAGSLGSSLTYESVADNCTSAQLRNGDGTYIPTKNNADAGESFGYVDGVWKKLVDDGCIVIDKTDNENWKYLAKPAGYVELKKQRDEEGDYDDLFIRADHTYQSADETREFILTLDDKGNCQWWEVEDVEENDALKHCTHPDNDKYYYWGTDPITGDELWLEKRFTITWVTKPYDSEDYGLVEYEVNYKSTPKYLGTNPSRPMNDYYTYDFIGWTPELVPVTDDAVYVAQFQQKDRKYMITFQDEDGSVLEEALWKMGEVPVCVNQPTPAGKILAWEPTIRAVTGDATYRATYTDELPSSYEIAFVNWNGETLKKEDGETDAVYTVNVGEIPVYDGATPTKPAIADKAFEFDGWTPDLAPVSEAVVYTAKFREKPATYTVTFKRAVGNEGVTIEPAETIQVLENVPYGEMPVCTSDLVPTKTSTAAEYYTVIWSPTLAAVTGNATYTATGFAAHKNTCRLTVSAGANGEVAVTKGGEAQELSAIYEYGDEVKLTATADEANGYHFARWSDGNTTNPRTLTVNAAITLKAEFAINQYTITWLDYNDEVLFPATTTVNHGETPTHAAPARATSEGTSYTFNGWDPEVTTATTNATYKATYSSILLTYTIRLVLNNGMSDIVRSDYHYGDAITIDNPVRARANGINYNFIGWKSSNNTYYAYDAESGTWTPSSLPVVTNNEIYTAQWEAVITDMVAGNSSDDGKDITITESGTTATSLTIEKDGSVNIPISASLEVEDFILESNTNQTGQLIGAPRLTAAHAYFDVKFNSEAGTAHRTWYAIAVPWEVDAENGILWKEGNRKLVLGRDFDLVWYDGAERAANGDGFDCWRYVEYETDKMMHPGKAYMMYFGSQFRTVRFEKNAGAPIVYTGDENAVTTVKTYALGTGESKDANWNGIANPAVYHATLNAGTAYGQVLGNGNLDDYFENPQNPVYNTISLSNYKMVVGKPVFVQAPADQSIVVNPVISGAASAPRRTPKADMPEGIEAVWQVTIGVAEHPASDNLFVQIADDKENGYVLGQDLAKGGVAKTVPQLWVNNYNSILSVNTQVLMNNRAEYPLGIFVPKADEYTITAETQTDGYELYLTLNGEIIWNLSNNAYTVAMTAGNTAEYGLCVISKAPQIATGMDEAIVDAQGEVRKVLIDNKVYIIRGNQVYSVDGQLVK